MPVASSALDKLFVSHGGLSSLCFDRESFFQTDFNVDSFLSSHTQRGLSLEILKDDLATYRKILQSALIQLIDREYADFVHLSSSLVGIDKSIEDLRKPISDHLRDCKKTVSDVSTAVQEMERKIQHRSDIRSRKRQLKALSSVMQWTSTLFSLQLLLSEESSSNSKLALLYRSSDLLKRIYQEEIHISSTLWYGTARERLALADVSVMRALGDALVAAVETSDIETAKSVFCAYEHIGRQKLAYDAINDRYVRPKLTSVVEDFQRQRKRFEDLLDHLLVVVERDLYILTYIADEKFVLETIWISLCDAVSTAAQPYFIPDQPGDFHKNYSSFKSFLRKMVSSLSSVHKNIEDSLMSYPATSALLDRWSLPIYYQVRFMEIGAPLEKALSEKLIFLPNYDSSGFRFESTKITWNAILRCWDTEICLEELVHRFWKLTLLIISRYVSYMQKIEWKSEPESSLPAALSDIATLIDRLPGISRSYVLPFLIDNPKISVGSVESILKESLKDSLKALSDLEERNLELLGSVTSSEVAEVFKQVQDIPRIYRRTNREVPSSHSGYVDAAFDLILRKVSELNLPAAQKDKFLKSTLKDALRKYCLWALELLESVRRMEESLKKLRKGKAVDGEGAVSDDDKIRMQLALDLQRTRDLMTSRCVVTEDFADFMAAYEKVLSEKPLLSQTA